jgi:hypothetical protein
MATDDRFRYIEHASEFQTRLAAEFHATLAGMEYRLDAAMAIAPLAAAVAFCVLVSSEIAEPDAEPQALAMLGEGAHVIANAAAEWALSRRPRTPDGGSAT